MKFQSVDFELFVAQYYQNKVQSCKSRGVHWGLSLISVRNLLRTKTCPWTGITLTVPRLGKPATSSDISIDRIDNKKGYVPGNVIAIATVANNFKSIFENPIYPISIAQAQKMLGKVERRLEKSRGLTKP